MMNAFRKMEMKRKRKDEMMKIKKETERKASENVIRDSAEK